MKLTDVLERHAAERMSVELVTGEAVVAESWTVGDELLEAHKQSGRTVYIALDKIVLVRVRDA